MMLYLHVIVNQNYQKLVKQISADPYPSQHYAIASELCVTI